MKSMSVKEIEQAIQELPRGEFQELVAWMEEHHNQIWDKQIEEDLEAGRLDALIAEAEADYAAGLARPL